MGGLLTDEAREALRAPTIQVANLVELDFRFGVERYWTGQHPLEFDGETWVPTGILGSVSNIESSQELRANGIELKLVLPTDDDLEKPVSRFQDVRASDYKNRSARMLVAFFDPTFNTVIHCVESRFFMDSLNYEIAPEAGTVITMTCESELLAAGKRQVRRWTDSQQRADFPDDLGMQYLTYLASGVEIKWGVTGSFFR